MYFGGIMSKNILFLLMASVSVIAMPDDASAEVDTVAPPADIMVTAQRRDQKLQDVPLSVSVVNAASLDRQVVKNTVGLLRLFPNLSGGQITGAGSANNYSMRGLYNSETAATFDSPVATYVDGIPIARLNASNFTLFDVERVEVLRGPQGTLFGRNTTGGAINIILAKPSAELGGFLEAGYGNYEHGMVRGAINIPVGENVRARLSGYKMAEEGWAHNVTTGGNNNDHDGWGLRGAASVDIAPSVSWEIAADYSRDFDENLPVRKVNGQWQTRSGLIALGSLVSNAKGNISGNLVGNDSYGITSNIKMASPLGQIELISGYRHLKTRYNIDYFDGPTAIGGFDAVQESTHRQYSIEGKISGNTPHEVISYTAGIFWFHENNRSDFSSVFRLASGNPFIDADRILFNSVDSAAIYGQVDFNLSKRLTFTAGARWTQEDKDIHYRNNGNSRASVSITDSVLVAGKIPLTLSKTIVTPRFALQYHPAKDVMLFASATRGFKSGGWNVRGTSATTLREFLPETIWSYESGIRSSLWGGRMRFNLTGFYGRTKDLQIATAVVPSAGAAPLFPIGNFADFESYGGEAEADIQPVQGFNIFANLGWNETAYKNPTAAVLAQQSACLASIAAGAAARPNCGAGIIRTDGHHANPARAPKWTGMLGFSYEIPLSDQWMAVPAASGRWVGPYNTNASELIVSQDDGYFLLSGSFALERADHKLRISLSCENCNNSSYLLSVIGASTFYNSPRRWYATVRAGF
jgi:iron complex outermembrane recepter protein